jgi:hypothetical protein
LVEVLAADSVYCIINPAGSPFDRQGALGLLVANAAFLLNHNLVSQLARARSLSEGSSPFSHWRLNSLCWGWVQPPL